MNEETIQAARRAWANDPEAAAQALLGCSAEELFITALRGCNQHGHKPGCPEAEGGGSIKPGEKGSYENPYRVSARKPRVLARDSVKHDDGTTSRRLDFGMRDEYNGKISYYTAISKNNGLWEIIESEDYADDDKYADEPALDEDDAWVRLTEKPKSQRLQEYMNKLWDSNGGKVPYFHNVY